jgi:acyl-coenzyme A thioesterase PaaI-like protein
VNAQRIEALLRRLCPMYEQIGLRVERAGDEIVTSVPLTPFNANHLGGMHAAVQWAAAEATGGIAYSAHPEFGRCWVAVRSFAVDFRAVARTAVRATAAFGPEEVDRVQAQLRSRATADYSLSVAVHDTAGRLVAEGAGAYHLKLLDGRRAPGPRAAPRGAALGERPPG